MAGVTPSQEAASPYLPPAVARGCPYCFDPESPMLRAALLPHSRRNPLPTAPFLADLVFLHQLLRRQYAGYPDWLQQRGFDPDAFFARWMDTVRAAGSTISFHVGVVEPLVALRLVVPDHHLLIRGAWPDLAADSRLICREYQAIVSADTPLPDRAAVAGIPGARPVTLRMAPLLRADGRMATVLTLTASGGAPALTLRQRGREIVLSPRPQPPIPPLAPPEIPAYEHHAVGDFTVITLRSFATSTAVRQQVSRLADDYPEHARRPALLFDLRDNQGGSLEYMRAWIAHARQGEWRSHPYLEVGGALWPCGPWNLAVERQVAEGTVDTPEAQEERERLHAAWSEPPPEHPSQLGLGIQRGRATHPYTGRVFALLNRNTGSSGELAALDLQRALGAVLVGERSAGTMQYGDVRRFVLPHTGLVCQIPTRRFFFAAAVEAVGVPVDVYLERVGQDVTELVPSLDRLWAAARTRPFQLSWHHCAVLPRTFSHGEVLWRTWQSLFVTSAGMKRPYAPGKSH